MLETRPSHPDAVGGFLLRRAKLEALLRRRGSSGLRLAQRHTVLADRMLRELYDEARRNAAIRPSTSVGLYAVGSYGRGELGWKSDLDVLFTTHGRCAEIASLVEAVLYPLWDAGVSIGHQVMRVDDLLENAHEALPTATALLDLRLIAGDAQLTEGLRERARQELFVGDGLRAFLARLRGEVEQRWRRFGDSVYLLEPDVKNGAGGLRDADVVRWTARAGLEGVSLDAVVNEGGLTPLEAQSLHAATDFFCSVRNHLHYAARRRNDRLTFDQQELVAMRMGYQEGLPLLVSESPQALIGPTVEAFMSDYYQHAHAISRAQEQVLARIDERFRSGAFSVHVLADGIVSYAGHLSFAQPEAVSADPTLALKLYVQAMKRGEQVAPAARDLITHLTTEEHGFSATLRKSAKAAELFRELLCTTRPAPFRNGSVLAELHAVGLLLAMIPEFAPVVGRVHHDLYHVYTVDVHSIAAVDQIRALMRGELMQRHPLGCRLAAELYRPQRLLFAALLHDVGKVFGGKEHSIRGAAMARAILARLGVESQDIEHIAKLILHHLTMYFVAARRDLADPETIDQFAGQVGNQDSLRNLYLLTLADISTTAPTSMTSWKSRMLDELYAQTNDFLRGSGDDGSLAQLRAELYTQTAGTTERADLDRLLDSMPQRYLLSNLPAEVAAHAAAVAAARGKRVHVQLVPSRHEGFGELCVVTSADVDSSGGDRPGLLALIAAALMTCRLHVYAAQIYTRAHTSDGGGVLDVFWVRDRVHGVEDIEQTVPRVEQVLDQLLAGEVTPHGLLQRQAPTRWSDRPAPPVPTEVVIENRSSDSYSIIEVITQDRPGVLFALSHVLQQLGLSIAFAKVNTEGNRVVDIFYVTELGERKIGSRQRSDQVKSALAAAVDVGLTKLS